MTAAVARPPLFGNLIASRPDREKNSLAATAVSGKAGSAPGVASPLRLSATPVEYRNAPPTLGQHTHQVLTELLCLDEATLLKLEQAGVIQRG